jgi:glutamine---fructose-6-phosphate transaminase (isomerizing)
MIEELARIPVEVDYGSEFRYRNPLADARTLAVAITQSGETADTLAALREAKAKGARSLAICNVVGSMATREAEGTIYTHAGPEIGVASTKAFSSQLAVLVSLAVAAGKARGTLGDEDEQKLVRVLAEVPRLMSETLRLEARIEALARDLAHARDVLYLGRGTSYALAMEGALKLKEISYIHAEGYAAGELKHGPIALVDEQMPVVVIAPHDYIFDKTVSNMQEVAARGGRIILVTDPKGAAAAAIETVETLVLPEMAATITPLVYAIPVQLLAYHTAVFLGTDVDQPRNLAKSVTVE